ncbi:hypothetical protein BN871_AB_00620 [Paenibacillus sp. P22]|nr:hypothetical protein BN871_AB_00620 [Paenibacillus sp. P22]
MLDAPLADVLFFAFGTAGSAAAQASLDINVFFLGRTAHRAAAAQR